MRVDGDHPPPYGTRPTRWIRPVLLALLLVAFDDAGAFAVLGGAYLLLFYLPLSLLRRKYRGHRRERFARLAIYAAAVASSLTLAAFNDRVAEERAARIVAAVEAYAAVHGRYPERLEELVPRFLPAIPAKAKYALLDRGFQYRTSPGQHILMYTTMAPYGRRYFTFETGRWQTID